jgi:hypothetical protein
MLGGLWPHVPLHAVATDRAGTVVVTTAFVDDAVEAFFYLDSMTGMLMGAAPSRHAGGRPFQATWVANINNDFATVVKAINSAGSGRRGATRATIDLPKSPQYLLTSGIIDIRGTSGRERPGRAILYVAEANTGIVMAYMITWSPELHSSGQIYRGTLVLWSYASMPTAVLRETE